MSSSPATELRPFQPGTTGWTAADLDDPRIEREWFKGRYEIVEGVLTIMPPAYFAGSNALLNLVFEVKSQLKRAGVPARFATEVDVVVDDQRVVRADAVMLSAADAERQEAAVRLAGRPDPDRTRILIPPTLVIESISPGPETHDRRTKRAWYEEFGVPHYWLLDGFERTLECLHLSRKRYRVDVAGRGDGAARPALFAGLVIPLKQVWTD